MTSTSLFQLASERSEDLKKSWLQLALSIAKALSVPMVGRWIKLLD
jgi:hypothetical protein